MGEAADSCHVTRAKHAGRGLQSCRIDLQPAPFGSRQARAIPGFEVGASPGGDEEPLRPHARAGLQPHHNAGVGSLDPDAWVAHHEADAVCLQVRPQRVPRVGLLQPEKSRSGFDDGHLRAKARERLAQLHPDGTASEHGERNRELAGNCGLAVGPVLDALEAGNRRNRRGAAVCDDDGFTRDISFVPHLQGSLIHELAFPSHQLCAGCFEGGRRSRVVEVSSHPQHPLGDLGKIELPIHARSGESASAISLGQCLAGSEKGFRRDASPVRALAANQLALNHSQGETAAFKTAGDRLARDSPAQAHDVKFLRHRSHLHPQPRGAKTREAIWR